MAETALSVFRNEKKYLVPYRIAMLIQRKFDEILARDAHARTSGYAVRSLYFDSINNIDYRTKLAGVEKRKKIRLRLYSPSAEKCKLELKEKDGDLQHKISLWISREDAQELMKIKYSVLTKYFEESQDAIIIYTTMIMGGYRPVVMVEYDRIAYTYPLFQTRLTIDTNVQSSESNLDLFSENPLYTILMKEEAILEVKYNQKLVRFISDILRQYHLTQCSVSKYCMGRKVFFDFEF